MLQKIGACARLHVDVQGVGKSSKHQVNGAIGKETDEPARDKARKRIGTKFLGGILYATPPEIALTNSLSRHKGLFVLPISISRTRTWTLGLADKNPDISTTSKSHRLF
jgi:hypothetical protein